MATVAFDTNTQFFGTMGNQSCEFGEVSFTTSGTTVDVGTYLSKVHCALVTAANSGATADAETFSVTKPTNGLVTDGKLTISRTVETGQSGTNALTVWYMFIGMR